MIRSKGTLFNGTVAEFCGSLRRDVPDRSIPQDVARSDSALILRYLRPDTFSRWRPPFFLPTFRGPVRKGCIPQDVARSDGSDPLIEVAFSSHGSGTLFLVQGAYFWSLFRGPMPELSIP